MAAPRGSIARIKGVGGNAGAVLRWDPGKARRSIFREMSGRLGASADYVVRDIQNHFDLFPAGEYSEGGEIPHIHPFGHLKKSIKWRFVSELEVDIFSDTLAFPKAEAVGSHLEFGTIKAAPRPFMEPGLQRNRVQVRRILRTKARVGIIDVVGKEV